MPHLFRRFCSILPCALACAALILAYDGGATFATTTTTTRTTTFQACSAGFISVTLDASQLIGDFWNSGSIIRRLEEPRLRSLAKALFAATKGRLVGGTDADNVFGM